MTTWKDRVARLATRAEDNFDQLKARLSQRLGVGDPVQIQPYFGYGTRRRVTLLGRVLENEGVTPPKDADSIWRNALNMYRRLESDEIPNATVSGTLNGTTATAVTDEEGYFTLVFELPGPLPADTLWHPVALRLEEASVFQEEPVTATGKVLTPPETAVYGVISDVDDTVLQSSATDYLQAARLLFLHNARTRLPFSGVAALYRAFQAGASGAAGNPIFYVSSSPRNLFLLLVEFFQFQGIPLGPLFLKDYGLDRDQIFTSGHEDYKLAQIETILNTYPDLPFLLVGDSGQKDPEIYAEAVERYPERIRAVYVRDVTDPARDREVKAIAERVAAAGTPMLLAPDSQAVAVHAAELGLIDPEAVTAVAAAKAAESEQIPLDALKGGTRDEG